MSVEIKRVETEHDFPLLMKHKKKDDIIIVLKIDPNGLGVGFQLQYGNWPWVQQEDSIDGYDLTKYEVFNGIVILKNKNILGGGQTQL